MRVFKLGLMVMFVALCFATANGSVRRCLALDPYVECSAVSSNKSDFRLKCGDVNVAGITACAIDDSDTGCSSSTIGDKVTSLQTHSNSACNRKCYCRIIYPVASTFWVAPSSSKYYPTDQTCRENCVAACVMSIKEPIGVEMRRNLFNDVINF